jgi:hypothetical protein
MPERERQEGTRLGALSQDNKPFTVYICHLHHSTDVINIANEIKTLGFEVINVSNIQIKKRKDDKSTYVKLPLFKVDIKPDPENKKIFSINSLLHYKVTVKLHKANCQVVAKVLE